VRAGTRGCGFKDEASARAAKRGLSLRKAHKSPPRSGSHLRMNRSSPLDSARQHPGKDVWAMTLDSAVDLIRQTLILALLVSAPMLIIGMVVGIVISLLQAVTQIQEQTLTFIPKIVAMVAAAIFLMPWISHMLIDYATKVFSNAPM
jgi:flagellar biosynthetic protein FliQ